MKSCLQKTIHKSLCFLLIFLVSAIAYAAPTANSPEGTVVLNESNSANFITPLGCQVTGHRYVDSDKCAGGKCYVPEVNCCGNNITNGPLYDATSSEQLYAGETCDGQDYCREDCTYCGDSIQQEVEECELGSDINGTAGSGCTSACQIPVCGNDIWEIAGNEVCDSSSFNPADSDKPAKVCDAQCQLHYCGDALIENDELCDGTTFGAKPADFSNNKWAAKICTEDCQFSFDPYCGDTIIDAGEQCDSTTFNAADADKAGKFCNTDNCVLQYCGDGAVNAGEQCDQYTGNGNAAASYMIGAQRYYCSASCTHVNIPFCGDSNVNPGEQCDGASFSPADASKVGKVCNNCSLQYCGDGTVNAGEQCDQYTGNGNAAASYMIGAQRYYCSSSCTHVNIPFCGDGTVNAGEACDDGNANNSDSCSTLCRSINVDPCADAPQPSGYNFCVKRPGNPRFVYLGDRYMLISGGRLYTSTPPFQTGNGCWTCANLRYGGCFVPETKITMFNGVTKAIQEISVGEAVLNPATGKASIVKKIVESGEKEPIIKVSVKDRNLSVTQTHPFPTNRGYLPANELMIGDILELEGGRTEVIIDLEELMVDPTQRVINLSLDVNSTDFDDHLLIADGIVTGDLYVQENLNQGR